MALHLQHWDAVSLTQPDPASARPGDPPIVAAQTSQFHLLPLSPPPQALGWYNVALHVLSMDVCVWTSGPCGLLPAPDVLGSPFFSPGFTGSKWLDRGQCQLLLACVTSSLLLGKALHVRLSGGSYTHIIFVGEYFSLSSYHLLI